ncbi:MAG: SPASM domain-containing protein, partial [Bacteroidales bacterium]|nr:SPASM domain-containing protein [Bacteroidales bacterium]
VPNFTTSGYGMTPEIAALCKQYCGAVAVSWYRNAYTLNAIDMLLQAGVKTNIHYVVGNNSIDELIGRLANNDFPKGINAIVLLLHKPAGLGKKENMLSPIDPRVPKLFAEVEKRHPFKVGMDSCSVPGALRYCRHINPGSLDSCEGGRFSCYIGADMTMVPCSFDQKQKYAVSLQNHSIEEAWNSHEFNQFRNQMRGACPNCGKKDLCMGGCPLMPEIVLCDSADRKII